MRTMPVALLMLFPLAAPARAQESAASFDAPLVTLGRSDRYAFLTDLDHDGFQDAVSWWWSGGYYNRVSLKGYRNDGTGKLVLVWYTQVDVSPAGDAGSASMRVLPCQLESDGSTDICLAYSSWSHATIRVLRSNGLSAPVLVDDYSLTLSGFSTRPELSAVVTDFTGDGLADLAYALNGNLKLMEFVPGQPGLTLRSSTFPFGSASSVVKGLLEIDANGDATPDLMAWRESSIQLAEVQSCQVTATQSFSTGTIAKPAVGDIDRDGDEDLVMWNTTTYAVARRTGQATWTIEPHVTGGPAEFLYDVDQDGDLDGVCCSSGGSDTPDNMWPSIFRVSVNDGTGAFAPSIETAWLGSDHLAGVTDLDHDGDMDVVAGRCILYARGPLTQSLHPLVGLPKTERSTVDIDGDSDPDFTVGLRIMERNQGEGLSPLYTPSFPAPPPGTQFVGPGWPGDFDGDGDVDLVAKHRAGTTLLAQRLIVNLGGGAFADAGDAGPSGVDFNPGIPPSSSPDSPDSSLAEDADGDGDVDLITRGIVPNGYRSRVWWNDGVGHFTAGPQFLDQYIQHVADLTGDGIPDLAGGLSAASRYVCWNEGLGGGVFGPSVQLQQHGGSRFALADLDADGDLDFALASSSNLILFWNEGGGVFTHEWESSVSLSNSSSAGQRVWSTDVDGDGLLDLLVTGSEYEANSVIVLRRKADNSDWDWPSSQVVFPDGYAGSTLDAVVRDVDGDGDEDFVTGRLIRNGTHSLPDGGKRRQYGTGTPGTGGFVPTLGADGPFRLGESGELRIRGGVGGATGLLTVTLVRGGQRGPNGGWLRAPDFEPVLAQIPFTLSGTPGAAGTGSWTRAFPVLPAFVGQTRRYVVEIFDPAAQGGVARSNAMLLFYGH